MNIRFQEHLPLTVNDLKGWCILSSSCPSMEIHRKVKRRFSQSNGTESNADGTKDD